MENLYCCSCCGCPRFSLAGFYYFKQKKGAWLAHRNFYLNDFQIMLVSSLLLQLQMMLFSIPIRAIVVCVYFARDLQEFFKEKLTFCNSSMTEF